MEKLQILRTDTGLNSTFTHRETKRIWLVIEGDNGAGKDTLAAQLATSGFELINAHPSAQSAERRARRMSGGEKIAAFLEYNRTCAGIAQNAGCRVVQIRYWPSTLAAAYADNIMTWEQVQAAATHHAALLMQPTMLLYLECNHEERIKRIAVRGPLPDKSDDVSAIRAARHKAAMTDFSTRLNHWVNLNCTTLSPKEVFARTIELLSN